MSYATDILSRRNMISAAFRIAVAKEHERHTRKMEKKFGSIIRDAYEFVQIAEGNCLAAMEDSVDERLSLRFGWKTIRELRADSIDALKKEMRVS